MASIIANVRFTALDVNERQITDAALLSQLACDTEHAIRNRLFGAGFLPDAVLVDEYAVTACVEAAEWVERLPDDATVSTADPNGGVPDALRTAALAVVAAFPEMFTDEPLSGADAVDRLGQVLGELRHALIQCGVDVPEPVAEPDEDEPTGPLAPILEARGYVLTDTAGGCKAWVRTMENGEQVVVTSTDGGSEPTRDDWLIGRYDDFPSGEYASNFTSSEDRPDGTFEQELSGMESVTLDESGRMPQGDEGDDDDGPCEGCDCGGYDCRNA